MLSSFEPLPVTRKFFLAAGHVRGEFARPSIGYDRYDDSMDRCLDPGRGLRERAVATENRM